MAAGVPLYWLREMFQVTDFLNSNAMEQCLGQETQVRVSLSPVSQAQLDHISLRLNQRPRKTLGFQTPASKLQASVATTI